MLEAVVLQRLQCSSLPQQLMVCTRVVLLNDIVCQCSTTECLTMHQYTHNHRHQTVYPPALRIYATVAQFVDELGTAIVQCRSVDTVLSSKLG